MMKKPIIFKYVLLFTICVFLLSGCDTGKLRIGEVRMMYGTNTDGRISYAVTTFTGLEKGSFEAEQDQTIKVDYDVQVTKGTLIIELLDPHGEVLWKKELIESESEQVQIQVEIPGRYTVLIHGKGVGGSFDVSWGTE